HHHIRQDHPRIFGAKAFKRLTWVMIAFGNKARDLQALHLNRQKIGIIIDQADADILAHARINLKIKWAPSWAGASDRSPPRSRAISREITRPNPTPCDLEVTKGMKIWLRISGGMPGPLSMTANSTQV